MKTLLAKELPQGRFWNKAWSLVEGCTPISPGCANCWLAGLQNRNLPNMAKGVINPGSKHFNGIIKCHHERLDMPLHRRKPTVYAIWSDLFHEGVSPEFRMRAFSVMAMRPRHHFIIVTKRPAEASDFLAGTKEMWRDILAHKAGSWFGDDADCFVANSIEGVCGEGYNVGWPLSNVTILVTMEDQQRAAERGPHAARLAAAGWKIGALCEPLLGPIDLEMMCVGCGHLTDAECPGSSSLCRMRPAWSWIITGGESGPKARPAHPEWFRSLRDQAAAAGVPFMFKQWGEWLPGEKTATSGTGYHRCDNGKFYATNGRKERQNFGTDPDPNSGSMITCRVGKKEAGNFLDGVQHLEVQK